jgi:DNA-binding NarL/FixJ family response regulator
MIDVVVVDDHALIRSGLIAALTDAGFNVIAEAASKAESLAVLNQNTPDFCIIDLNLGDGSGLEVIKELSNKTSKTNYVVLTMDDDETNLAAAKRSGASAYILKSEPVTELIEVLRNISDGKEKFQIAGRIKKVTQSKDFNLTEKEKEVLQLLGSGATASVMGKQLFLTEATIKTHLAAIYRKLSASNRAQALSIAISNNLISD